ncbi:Putative enoyl-CoA hydratase EchA13 [bacterium HR29]|mgnify:CR=1 FL=1|jgi:enoyl-CoA hydratase|nr:Putative enoyl-CoA hydratase EchA13 [bacterium HR29]
MKEYRDILTIKRQRHGIVQLNRPEKMNALSHNLRAELFDALKDFEADPDVKVIIIRGSGRAFSAGYDLSGISETPDDRDYVDRRSGLPNVGPIHPGQGQWPQHLLSGYWIIWELAKPVIAQVHGYCLAGGTELASMCDLMFVAEDAIIGYPPLRAMTSVDILYHPWHMHQRKVRELLYTGDSVTGKEAVELGWANRAYPIDQLAEATEAFAERIANIDSALLQMTKRQINRAYEIMGIRTALAVGGDIQELSRVRPGGGEFGRIAREKGLKAALDWRDGPFGDYGSAPADAPRPAPAPW